MPSINPDGRYLCTLADLQALLDDTCKEMLDTLDDLAGGYGDPKVQAIITEALQAWHDSASPASPTPEGI